MSVDYIFGGTGHGTVAERLLASNMDPNVLRPFLGPDGHTYQTVLRNGKYEAQRIVTNAPALLRREDWIHLDNAVVRAARPRLRVVGDIRGAGLTYIIPNGMGKTVLEYPTMGDITPATISMDGLRQSESDRPEFDIGHLPLPIVHKDFDFTLRDLAVSRNSNTPLDTTMAELAGRQVAEEVERLTLGTASSFYYGGGTVYGLTNFPGRNTKTLTSPEDEDWTPQTCLAEVIEMRQQAYDDRQYGPYVLYVSPGWDAVLDADFSAAKGDNTLRERILKLNGISRIETVDFLTGFQMVLVQLTSDNVRMVIGMDIQTLQWETHGGMRQHFKVMCIIVPQVRTDAAGNSGIVHGSAPA